MSIIKANRLQWTDGSNRNHVVQVSHTTSTSVYSDSGSSYTVGTAGFAAAPSSTSGLALITTTFQPKLADSIIVFESSSIDALEGSNVSDDYRLFVHAGTTLMCWNYSGIKYDTFSGNQNAMQMHLYGFGNSWGTDSRTIRFALDYTSSTAMAVNYRYGTTSWAINPIRLTIMEIAK